MIGLGTRIVGGFGLLVALSGSWAYGRDLTFEQRVEAQRAIEQVYWAHRIWPEENRGAKPPLSEVMPDRVIRARVEDYVQKSNALRDLWTREIQPEQLQAEIDRMVAGTRDPVMLRELFLALKDDPFLIAETLARASLSDRLIRGWYATDDRFHSPLRRAVKVAASTCHDTGCMKAIGGTYEEFTLRRDSVPLDEATWNKLVELPLSVVGRVEENEVGFELVALLSRDESTIRYARVTWLKVPFASWWAQRKGQISTTITSIWAPFTVSAPQGNGCTSDTWSATSCNAPSERDAHTGVWTGAEMIIFGGNNGGLYRGVGGRYSPATDTWVTTSPDNAPSARIGHTAIWTGTEMIVWGGREPGDLNTGGRYNPATDVWLATSLSAGVPVPRTSHSAIWTGTEMIVWGGSSLAVPLLSTGGRYNPSNNTWTATATSGAPSGRGLHTAIWTGTQMIIWGGNVGGSTDTNTGGRYNPVSDTWSSTSTGAQVPSARSFHTAVWTGTEMIIWGGGNTVGLTSGGRYDPTSDGWTATATVNAPVARSLHTAVWTGTQMIVWGGREIGGGAVGPGGRYTPANDSWVATSSPINAPTPRYQHSAVWTGTEMIIWGGHDSSLAVDDEKTGARYRPADDTWIPTSTESAVPGSMDDHTAVWTGAEMIVWGLRGGARYDPATNSWLATSGVNPPSGRGDHTAVWTGTEMIVWGGYPYPSGEYLDSGARYSPAQDLWSPTSAAGVPAGRAGHTAVWSGQRMIVWGGQTRDGTNLASGGLYDPVTDAWSPLASSPNEPSPRSGHTAVWTGTRMIVWGGRGGTTLSTGGVYDPSGNSWVPTSTGPGVPQGREGHTAVWTGTEMIVWGGSLLNSGGRYNPATDTWAATSVGPGVPEWRMYHMAVWTGADMIVWGGSTGTTMLADGARYNPATNTWSALASSGSPSGRHSARAVWTDTQGKMLLWGGRSNGGLLGTGGAYCACSADTWYRDADGDGYGITGTEYAGCARPGYVAVAGDCDDANPGLNPGMADNTCNGIDENCSGTADDGFPPQATSCGVGACIRSGTTSCVGGVIHDSCVPGSPLAPSDLTCDGVDDDCSGADDEDYVVNTSGWLAVTPTSAPSARERHTVTCSSTEALVWGGYSTGPSPFLNTGARYDAVSNTWVATSNVNAPDPRRDHRTLWANGEWIVWGGERNTGYTDTGGRYNPATGTWMATTTSGPTPAARSLHSMVWIGAQNRLAIWGGRANSVEMNSGAFYVPSGNNWANITNSGAPAARYEHTAVVGAGVMIVWGGRTISGSFLNTGGRYDYNGNSWAATATSGAPSGRTRHVAVWTGTRMIVWGGWNEISYFGDGAAYDPTTNTWTSLPASGAPTPRRDHIAVWTGSRLLIWGGIGPSGPETSGASYDPATNTWSPLGTLGAPQGTRDGSGCWVDGPGRFVVWGGVNNGAPVATGGRYVPPTTCGLGPCGRQSTSSCAAGFENFACIPGTPQPETCNRVDEDCNGTVDDNVGGSPGTPCLMAGKGGSLLVSSTLSWPSFPGASSYDVVRGLLPELRSSAGNYTASVDACLANNLAALTITEPSDPPVGSGFWHLLRPNLSGGPGTYDETSPRQVGSRDAEIAAAAGACP